MPSATEVMPAAAASVECADEQAAKKQDAQARKY
jgi:hypothetical protein